MNRSCLLCIDLKWNLKWKVFLPPPPPPELQDSSLICSLGISYAVCPHCVRLLLFFFFLPLCSNKNRIQQTCTSPTCRCQWTSRSWRTCWNTSAKSFPHVSWGTPVDTAEEWASQGQILVDLHLKRAGVCDANPITIRFLRHINASLFKRTVRKKKKKKHWPDCSCVFPDKWEGPEELVYLNICWMTLRCLITVMALAYALLTFGWNTWRAGPGSLERKENETKQYKISFLCQAGVLWTLCAQNSNVEAVACGHVGHVSS